MSAVRASARGDADVVIVGGRVAGAATALLLARAGLRVSGHHHAHGLHSPYWWLKCAVGVHDDGHPAARAYHRLLVWDIMKRPAATRLAEQALNPLIGKSLVLYAAKPAVPAAPAAPASTARAHAAA